MLVSAVSRGQRCRFQASAAAVETESQQSRFGGRNVAPATHEFEFGRVAGYRLYGLDGVNKVASADWIDADDDEIAIEAAKEIYDGRECELWHGRRLVARLNFRRHG